MKTLNTQTVAKPSFTKSKAYGLCGTLALATALLIGVGSVSADETTVDTQPAVANVYTADNAGNVTVTPSETVHQWKHQRLLPRQHRRQKHQQQLQR